MCQAGVLGLCETPSALRADQQDKVLRFGSIIKAELDRSGQRTVLIARSGVDLSRFGFRYSHAGLGLKAGADGTWSIRQLYYACDQRKPRLYDQGMSGFLLGADAPTTGFVSVVFLPEDAAEPLGRVAADNRLALRVLGTAYSANAFAFSTRYQNCNQWVIELLAVAWGRLPEADGSGALRGLAQHWLQGQGYAPSIFDVSSRALMWLGAFIPWLHADDHPPEAADEKVYRVTMPASIEGFVHATFPGASRIEFCRNDRRVVVRRGWVPIAEACEPGEGDAVIALE